MRATHFTIGVGFLLCAASGLAQAPAIRSVTPLATRVPRYGKLELAANIGGQWSNPFDPDQADVTAEFVSPSGRFVRVPGFWYQGHATTTVTPLQARQQVTYLKLYAEEKAWSQHPSVEFLLDDLELREAGAERFVRLDDLEGPAWNWGPPEWVAPTEELAHSGKRALRMRAEIGGVEDWPGAVLGLGGADWSGYDAASLWVYPRVTAPYGTVCLYFSDGLHGNSPLPSWRVGSDELKPNQWNHLVWDWRSFPTSRVWEPRGEAGWRVRFCPTEVGQYSYRLSVRTLQGEATSPPGRFQCIGSDNPGFVRVSRDDPHYLDFDSGRAFVPIGHDVCWATGDAMDLFPKMHAAGENVTYYIMVPWDTSIEWDKLGEYSLPAAAKLDAVIGAAEKNGIYLKLSFDVHDALRAGAQWEKNPYSAERGGPCARPNDFYTSAEARKLYHRRLRYIAARWGYSTNIMAWEPVAEIDGGLECDGQPGWNYPRRPGAPAVRAMLIPFLQDTYAYLREVCPYQRLFTNSFAGDVSDAEIWALPEVEYTQLHHYDSADVGRTMADWCARLTQETEKPLMVTEFGWWADWTKPFLDREGVCQHNGIWASLLGGAAGAAQSWWWEHIDEWNLYPHYAALRRFVEGVDFPREGFRSAQAAAAVKPGGGFGTIRLTGSTPLDGAGVADFTVQPEASVGDAAEFPGFLLAAGRPERRVNPTFHVTYPADGTFSVHVDMVSPDAELSIFLDDQLAWRQNLPAENVPGKLCTFSERWKLWECRYDEDITVPVPAGKHAIRLENTKPGFSWIRTASYQLTNYGQPGLRVIGLQGRRHTLLWLQNPYHTWINATRGLKPPVVPGATLTLTGLPEGVYDVEWWDTYEGRPTARLQARPRTGKLTLNVPRVEKDVACKLTRR